MLPASTGKPTDSKWARTRRESRSKHNPMRTDKSNAITVPIATPSPCSRDPSYPAAASNACPNVCPKFSKARLPPSLSSASTIAALVLQLTSIACESASASKLTTFFPSDSSHSKNGKSPISPYLTTSAYPARTSRLGNVFNVLISAMTARG